MSSTADTMYHSVTDSQDGLTARKPEALGGVESPSPGNSSAPGNVLYLEAWGVCLPVLAIFLLCLVFINFKNYQKNIRSHFIPPRLQLLSHSFQRHLGLACAPEHMWGSGDSLWVLVLPFHRLSRQPRQRSTLPTGPSCQQCRCALPAEVTVSLTCL